MRELTLSELVQLDRLRCPEGHDIAGRCWHPRRCENHRTEGARERFVRSPAFATQLPLRKAELRRDIRGWPIVDLTPKQDGVYPTECDVRSVACEFTAARQCRAHVIAKPFKCSVIGRGVTPPRRFAHRRKIFAYERIAPQFRGVVEVAEQMA